MQKIANKLVFAGILASISFTFGCNRAGIKGSGNAIDQSAKINTSIALPGGTSTINNYYQGMTKEQLVDELKLRDEKIESLEALSKKYIYTPLTPQIMEDIVKAIPTCGPIKQVQISTMNNGKNEYQVANDLAGLLRKANLDSRFQGDGIALGGDKNDRISIKMNEKTFQTADKLAKILNSYLKGKFIGDYDNTMEDGVIEITIEGTVSFNSDGTVELPS